MHVAIVTTLERGRPMRLHIKMAEAENIDSAILEQQKDIQDQIAHCHELISDKQDIEVLRKEYQVDDEVYQRKLTELSRRYSHIRRTRGDGNCFYRSFGFGIVESFLTYKNGYDSFKEAVIDSFSWLSELGYETFTVQDFYETFLEIVESTEKDTSIDEILTSFRDSMTSDCFVVYLRLVVSCYLQKNAEFFSNFIEGGLTVKEFCNKEVEPMAKESDHIHVIALTSAVKVCVRIEYMDRGNSTGSDVLNHHDFPEDGSIPNIYLLYRPGHYDVLYPRITTEKS